MEVNIKIWTNTFDDSSDAVGVKNRIKSMLSNSDDFKNGDSIYLNSQNPGYAEYQNPVTSTINMGVIIPRCNNRKDTIKALRDSVNYIIDRLESESE